MEDMEVADAENNSQQQSRKEKLGFIPQKELSYNKPLPYAAELDEESLRFLNDIKTNLVRAVYTREFRPGCVTWTGRLNRYINLYGHKFSKEDHINFIKLLYELLIIPDLEPSLLSYFSTTYLSLTRKVYLLSPADLKLAWRPLYEVAKRLLYSPYEPLGMVHYPNYLNQTLRSIICASRDYFDRTATGEMLEEWRPFMCPFDSKMNEAIIWLELFLPTRLPPEDHQHGFLLWVDEMVGLWTAQAHPAVWQEDLMSLLSRAAEHNIGHINWEPMLPRFFSCVLFYFNLPVGYRNQRLTVSKKMQLGPTVAFIVANLGGGSTCQDHLSRLFKALESYYHPSNVGNWNIRLQEFLRRLAAAFFKRVQREKKPKKSWLPKTPASHQLTDEDITRFVETLVPVTFLAMFSKLGANDSSETFLQLARLRPNLVIPELLERLYSALETVTEPHRLTSTLYGLTSVARPLVRGGDAFPEGPSHVMTFLMSALPGIGPNDMRKTLVIFQLLGILATMVPIVDCSSATEHYSDLTSVEQSVCLQTAGFEDFVLQFIDRCIALVENSTAEQTRMDRGGPVHRMNSEESVLETVLASTLGAILVQCSAPIFDSALSKLHGFIAGRVLEPQVAGKFAARMCAALMKANAEKTLRVFLPSLLRHLQTLLSSDDALKEDNVDHELLYNMLLLSELIRSAGEKILVYSDQVLPILDRAVLLTSEEGYVIAGSLLENTLRTLTSVFPVGLQSNPDGFDRPVNEYLAIRDWGQAGDLDNLKVKWHVTNEEERNFASRILGRYLKTNLENLELYADKRKDLKREELQRSLSHTLSCLLGAGTLLPARNEEPLSLCQTSVQLAPPLSHAFPLVAKLQIQLDDGRHVRHTVAWTISRLVGRLLSEGSDDTKSLFTCILILQALLFYFGVQREDFESHQRSFQLIKLVLGSRGGDKDMGLGRALLIDRVMLQHEARVLESAFSLVVVTPTTQRILKDLVSLATSHYSEVRKQAQGVLGLIFRQSGVAHYAIMDELFAGLRPDASHEQLKGTLYLLAEGKKRSLLVRHDWQFCAKLWPAILRCPPSEKPSVIGLLEYLSDLLKRHSETSSIRMAVTDACVEAALRMAVQQPDPLEVEQAKTREIEQGQINEKSYYELVSSISDLLNSGSLHWRFYNMGLTMLTLHVRPDVPLPLPCVEILTKCLIHDTIAVRKLALRGVGAILRQHKRSHKKIQVDPFQNASQYGLEHMTPHSLADRVNPGERWDNSWLMYQHSRRPLNAASWNEGRYVHKTYYGYYAWPKQMYVYAPETEQPPLNRPLEALTAEEKAVFTFFVDESNVERLVSFLSLEERKGKDKFSARRSILFKGLFRNYGYVAVEPFRRHLERLVREEDETSQRCAAEIITGIISGSKHWDFESTSALWTWLAPLLRTAIANVSVESLRDWGTAIATASEDRDPNRMHWLLELLMEDPIRAEEGSFTESSRLYILQGGIAQQEWRVPELLNRLLEFLRPYLTHPYQKMRARLGSVLTNVFAEDFQLPGGTVTLSPRVSDFVEYLLPKLSYLLQHPENGYTKEDEEREAALRLLKTVNQWQMGMWTRTYGSGFRDLLKFLPLLCAYESNDADKELARECTDVLVIVSQTVLPADAAQLSLQLVAEIAQNGTWRARVAALEYLQVFLFNNLFTVCSQDDGISKVSEIVLLLLSDERLEVRETAAQVLGGLLHCDFFSSSARTKLLETFQQKASVRLPRRRRGPIGEAAVVETAGEATVVVQRHTGVLGLCAFVNAYPYDVPDFLPDVLMQLGEHLHDPQPIPMTVKKTLSNFRRTHHDNWQFHKQKFSDDQLVVLTDLLVSPNYYA